MGEIGHVTSIISSLPLQEAANAVRRGMEKADPSLERVEIRMESVLNRYVIEGRSTGGSVIRAEVSRMSNGETKVTLEWPSALSPMPEYRERMTRFIENEVARGERPPLRG